MGNRLGRRSTSVIALALLLTRQSRNQKVVHYLDSPLDYTAPLIY